MLAYKRPSGSSTESLFVETYLENIPNATKDQYGNIIVVTDSMPVLFTCHTDTVDELPGYRQLITEHVNVTAIDCILGADDCAGIWLMLAMISSGVGGNYIFHRDEELGALGAKHILNNNTELLNKYQLAVSFDAPEQYNLVSVQGPKTGCTPSVAEYICKKLGPKWNPINSGRTDSARYIPIIPNVVNLSVGYSKAHTKEETLDLPYLEQLRHLMISIDWQKLIDNLPMALLRVLQFVIASGEQTESQVKVLSNYTAGTRFLAVMHYTVMP